jgi:hypothetical protein
MHLWSKVYLEFNHSIVYMANEGRLFNKFTGQWWVGSTEHIWHVCWALQVNVFWFWYLQNKFITFYFTINMTWLVIYPTIFSKLKFIQIRRPSLVYIFNIFSEKKNMWIKNHLIFVYITVLYKYMKLLRKLKIKPQERH